jgi:hypothetical protein
MKGLKMKYLKIKSVTWWASALPLIGGLLLATEPFHGFTELVETIDNLSGGMRPYVMINAGMLGIGLRAAIK